MKVAESGLGIVLSSVSGVLITGKARLYLAIHPTK
jgi:hypothetical protein